MGGFPGKKVWIAIWTITKREGLRHFMWRFEGKGINTMVDLRRKCIDEIGDSESSFCCSSMKCEKGNVEILPSAAVAARKRKRTKACTGKSSDLRFEQASAVSKCRKDLERFSDAPVSSDTEQPLSPDWVEKVRGLMKGRMTMDVFDQGRRLDAKCVSTVKSNNASKSLSKKKIELDKRTSSCTKQGGGEASVIKKSERTKEGRLLQCVVKRHVVTKIVSATKVPATMAGTTRTEVLAWGRRISVSVTKEASVAQKWIEKQKGNLFGLDTEWRPDRREGSRNKVALLQLCGESDCLIIQLLHLDRMPKALLEFLVDPRKSFAGVGIHLDTAKLQQDYGLVCLGQLELTTLAVEKMNREDLKHAGMKMLLKHVLGFEMQKPKSVATSDWARKSLGRSQVEYACIDAWASFAI
eukprot:c21315_g1_i1 orf=352-1584(+)